MTESEIAATRRPEEACSVAKRARLTVARPSTSARQAGRSCRNLLFFRGYVGIG